MDRCHAKSTYTPHLCGAICAAYTHPANCPSAYFPTRPVSSSQCEFGAFPPRGAAGAKEEIRGCAVLRAIKVRGNPPFCHLEIPAGKSTKLLMSVQILICVLCMLAGKFIAIGESDFYEFRQRHVEIGAIFLDD
jgi:hypothetical protein